MKLWLVLYASGQIGGTWGPLPYNMDQCIQVRNERWSSIQRMIDTRVAENGTIIPAETVEKLKSWRLECEEHADRPRA